MVVEAGNGTLEAAKRLGWTHVAAVLVDDDPINLAVTQYLLEETGLIIDTAENGAQAISKARKENYLLIVMDMQMPIMNGMETTLQIRQLSGYSNTRRCHT